MKKLIIMMLISLLVILFCVSVFSACNSTCTVKFDTVEGSAVEDLQVKKGGTIAFNDKYKVPVKEGYSFQGWSYENGDKFNTNDAISKSLTLYAIWEIKQYNVVVNTNIKNAGEVKSYNAHDTSISADKYDYNTEISVELEKVYKGYDFLGWYDGEQLLSNNNIYTFSLPAKNTTLTATFKVQEKYADYKFTSDENQLTITSYIGNETIINIPYGVTGIGKSAFSNCREITKITIPNSVQSIGAYAFEYCKKLKSINIPYGVTAIENGTFYDCSSLLEVSIPSTIATIGTNSFYLCGKLSEIFIPDSVQIIKHNAFYMCGNSNAPLVIKCEATSQPAGWEEQWYKMCSGVTIEWGANN